MIWNSINPHLAHLHLPEHKERKVLEKFDLINREFDLNKDILDYGCGPGYLSRYVKKYTGYDISSRSVKVAQSIHPKATFTTNLPTRHFEMVVCIAVIQHMTIKEYKDFIEYCRTHTNEVLVQYRYAPELRTTEDIIDHLSIPKVEIQGFKTVKTLDPKTKDDYRYQYLVKQ